MTTYLIDHLRIPGHVPTEDGLAYLEQVEATVAPYGGKGWRSTPKCRSSKAHGRVRWC
jgi:hypothetical protein